MVAHLSNPSRPCPRACGKIEGVSKILELLTPEGLPPLAERPGVSFIMPVLNEAEHIDKAITTILAQDYAGDKEIVLALGPSTDDTNRIVADMAANDPRIQTVDNPQAATPIGLNLAFGVTSHPVIIRVDAHSGLRPDYTQQAIDTLRETKAANCGGLMLARGRTSFQKAVARAYMSPVGLGGPAYHSGDEAGEAESAYLGVYRREVLEELGGFDEGIKRGQDWELNLRIRTCGGRIWFNPDMEVTYWPRDSWSKISQQFWATGIWRAELIRRYGSQNSLRYFAPPVLVLGMAASVIEALLQLTGSTKTWPKFLRRFTSLVHVPSLSYVAGILATASAAKDCGRRERFWFGVVLPTMHLSWGAGFLKGLLTGAGTTKDGSR